jgi:hypothetical protein
MVTLAYDSKLRISAPTGHGRFLKSKYCPGQQGDFVAMQAGMYVRRL